MLDFSTFNDLVVESGMTKKKIAALCEVDVTTITRWCKRPDIVPAYAFHLMSELVVFIKYRLKSELGR